MVGFCELKQAFRVLRLDRIQNAQIIEMKFVKSPLFNELSYDGTMPFLFQEPYRRRP
jgi:predicted DNA-binding transcriptional regulator YafY